MADPVADLLAGGSVPGRAELVELEVAGQLDVRVDADGVAAAGEALGAPLPLEPNTVAGQALWLGPDEWLVVSDEEPPGPLEAALAALPGVTVVDLSANRRVLELRGGEAADLLAGGCALDLHPRAFGPGRCAQTLLAGVPVILWQVEADAYRVLVRPSFAPYLAAWLADATAELRG